MSFQARRLLADLRRVAGWVVLLALLSVTVAAVSTYNAAFGIFELRSGALSAPPEPAAFLRAVDPRESIVTRIDSEADLEATVLDQPGLAVLLERMQQDDRTYLALPLDAFVPSGRTGLSLDSRITAVVGVAPDFLPARPAPGTVALWGDLDEQQAGALGVTGRAVLGHPVEQVDTGRPDLRYVSGDGRRGVTEGPALVAFDPATATELGVSPPYHPSEVVASFTCRCTAAELEDLAGEMTDAEARAGTGRAFYAVDRSQLVGPAERSAAVSELLNAGHAGVTLLSVACLTIMAAQVFWRRNAHVYRVERLAGSSERALHVRAQALIAAGLTLPATTAVVLVNALLATGEWPEPLTPAAQLGALALIALLHVLAGALTAARLRRLCRP